MARKLSTRQQEIVDAVSAGAVVAYVTHTRTTQRGRSIYITREKRHELRVPGRKATVLREATVGSLVKRGLITVTVIRDPKDPLDAMTAAARSGDYSAAHAAIQEAAKDLE